MVIQYGGMCILVMCKYVELLRDLELHHSEASCRQFIFEPQILDISRLHGMVGLENALDAFAGVARSH